MRQGDRWAVLDRLPRAGNATAVAERQRLLRVHGRSVAWVPPLFLCASIAEVDWNTTGEFRVISWIVLVPGIAAAICGVWGTAAFAVLSLLTYVLVDNAWPHQYQTGLPDFILVALGGTLATLACAVRVRGERRMLHMRDIAETTRRTVLRPLPPGWGDLDHAAVYLAADSEARVGGDFYDIQPGPHGTRVVLGDVQGKGLGAVEAAAALLGTFREAAYHEPELATVADRLEVRMLRHVRYRKAVGRDDGERFATGVLVGFPETSATDVDFETSATDADSETSATDADSETSATGADFVEVVIFGHEPPLVVAPDGVRRLPPGDGLPLGFSELADGPPLVRRVALAPGETLLLVSDGVTEARDAHGSFYPLRKRVAEAVSADPDTADPQRLVRFVRDGTLRHCGGRLADDTTVFAVRRRGPGPVTSRSAAGD